MEPGAPLVTAGAALSLATTFDVASATSKNVVTNWARTYSCTPAAIHYVSSTQDVCDVIARARAERATVKVIGSGLSPSDIAMCEQGHLISMARMTRILSVDRAERRVTIEAGVTIAELNRVLPAHGLMLPVLGSISEQTFVGATQTGTHGTGLGVPELGAALRALTLVDGEGRVRACAEGSDLLRAARCGLGALGVIVSAVIQCVPLRAFRVVESAVTLDAALRRGLASLARSAQHVRLHWYPHTQQCVLWQADCVDETEGEAAETTSVDENDQQNTIAPSCFSFLSSLLPASLVPSPSRLLDYHALEALYYVATFVPRLVPCINGAYAARRAAGLAAAGGASSPNLRIEQAMNFDCLFRQHVSEYALPLARAADALRDVRRLIAAHGLGVHFPLELRFAAASDAWLSPCSGRAATAWIGVVMYRPYGANARDYERFFALFADAMLRAGGRPHWAKRHALTARDFEQLYGDNWRRFCELREQLDPQGLFLNDYLRRILQ